MSEFQYDAKSPVRPALRNDQGEIERTLNLIFEPGEVVEVRALKVSAGNYTNTFAGYFNDMHLAASEAAKIATAEGVYFTANRINPALLARSYNRIRRIDKSDPLTSDGDIIRRRLLPIDHDPQRPAKISSTDEEHAAAIAHAYQVRDLTNALGWPEPIIIDSGNGAQSWHFIDVPAADDHLIENCLRSLALQCDTRLIKIDLTLHNPARILKLPGTVARKGDDAPDRPHRLSRILTIPNLREIVSLEKLRELSAQLPKPTQTKTLLVTGNGQRKPFDLEAFISKHQLDVTGPVAWQGGRKWNFVVCPWNSTHTDHSAVLLQLPGGAIVAKCSHNSCRSKDWDDLRKMYESPVIIAPNDWCTTNEINIGTGKAAVIATNRPTTTEYITALGALGYSFRLNELMQEVEVNGLPLTDNLAAEIRAKMRDAGYKGMQAIEDAYIAHAIQKSYHPIIDYLNGLHWDGKDSIGLLAAHFEDNHTPLDNGDTVTARYLRRFLIGSVGKVFDQIQIPMLILEGPQGIGKSAFIRWLASKLIRYFVEGPINPDDRDAQIRLMSRWIWEVSEIGATIRRADVEALKSFITLRDVVVRKPYGKRDTRGAAVCSLIGTLNDSGTGFLNDPTGSRRALTISVLRIDWAYANVVDVDQVWAQAVAQYRAGESPYLLDEERNVQAKINAEFEAIDPVADLLPTQFDIDGRQFDWFTPSADILRVVDNSLKGASIGHSRAIAAALKRYGVVQDRVYVGKTRVRGYRGIRIKNTPTLAERHTADTTRQSGTDEDR